jgi:hypothetical protein
LDDSRENRRTAEHHSWNKEKEAMEKLALSDYLIAIALALGVGAILVRFVPPADANVSFSFDVGGIIAAILGGGGIAVAGQSFALRMLGTGTRTGPSDPKQDSKDSV